MTYEQLCQTPQTNLTNNNNQETQELLAKRSVQFISAFIEDIIGLLITIPFRMLSETFCIDRSGYKLPLAYSLTPAVNGFAGSILVHPYFLNKNSQTPGKKAADDPDRGGQWIA